MKRHELQAGHVIKVGHRVYTVIEAHGGAVFTVRHFDGTNGVYTLPERDYTLVGEAGDGRWPTI